MGCIERFFGALPVEAGQEFYCAGHPKARRSEFLPSLVAIAAWLCLLGAPAAAAAPASCGWLAAVPAGVGLSADAKQWVCATLSPAGSVPPTAETTDQLLADLQNAKGGIVTKNNVIIEGGGANDFTGQSFPVNLVIENSVIAAPLNFNNAHLASLRIVNSLVLGNLSAETLNIDQMFSLKNVYFNSNVDLLRLRAGYTSFSNVACGVANCVFEAENLSLAGNLLLSGWLGSLDGTGTFDLAYSTFQKDLYFKAAQSLDYFRCQSCGISGKLMFEGGAAPKPVLQLPIGDCKTNDWSRLSPLPNTLFCQGIDFSDTHVGADVTLESAVFYKFLKLDYASVQNLTMLGNTSIHQLLMRQAVINGSLITVPGSDAPGGDVLLQEVQLIGTSITKELNLSGLNPRTWIPPAGGAGDLGQPPLLDLTDVKAASFTDCLASYPEHLVLDGFEYGDYDRDFSESLALKQACTGHSSDDKTLLQYRDMDRSGTAGWLQWLGRGEFAIVKNEQPFDPQPYLYLATILKQKGFTSYADKIIYEARKRQMLDERYSWAFVGMVLLWVLTGFGIGGYFLFHALCTVVLSLVFAIGVLKLGPKTRELSYFWCLGAAIDHLLPIGGLDPAYKDFFDGKTDRKYNGKSGIHMVTVQRRIFMAYVIWGWFLASMLITAVTGVTQGS